MADTWTISPLIRPLLRKLDERGGCAYPQDFPHCHGAEIQHTDGTAECFNPGQPCPYPRPGAHAFVYTCADVTHRLTHRCTRCR